MDTGANLIRDGTVVVVDRTSSGEPSGPITHGRDALLEAIATGGVDVRSVSHWTETDRDTYLVMGTTNSRPVARLLDDVETSRSEGVMYQWCETDTGRALVVSGTDARGLAYALLELAERVDAHGVSALTAVDDAIQFPDNEIRGVDKFVETPVEDDWLFDDDFWAYYLDRLVRCRFNRFTLVTGYDTAYLSPPYPFIVDVPGYPDVRLSDNSDVSRQQHREQLRSIGAQCHEHGLEFVLGIWQQQPWTGYQGNLVDGLPEGERLADYCAAGLRELLTAVPEIDGVQLRVNYESGVAGEDDRATAEDFWLRVIDAVADASEDRGEEIGLDLRAKGLTDPMIDHGLERGLDVTVPTKFWCESTGLPYHTTQMREGELSNLDDPNRSRRYSYADLLTEPRAYDVLYRLWVTGTNRLFVWGDPDYARRFSRATEFGDSRGFEITSPLSLKGGYAGLREDGWPLFDDPDLRDYTWEDERYWAWYRLFGRVGYDRETDPDVWERQFEERFGDASAALLDGYRAASGVLPLLTAFHLTTHPALHNWAELDTGGALFSEHNLNETFGETTYLTAEPSDPGLFYRIDEYVEDELADAVGGKYTPVQVATWLSHFAARTRDAVSAAEPQAPDTGECRATILDLRMLADLADYHAHKVHAAIDLCQYEETGAPSHLIGAHASARTAREFWAALAARGEGTYHDDLVFGRGPEAADAGNWSDRLSEIDADIETLERLLDEEGEDPNPDAVSRRNPSEVGKFSHPAFDLDVPDRHPADEDLPIVLEAGERNRAATVRLHYRHANQYDGVFQTIEMTSTDAGYEATIPRTYIERQWDLLVYASAVADDDTVIIIPGVYNPRVAMPYHVVHTTRE